MAKKRVLLLMSGGVDSSVSAALLLRQGYEVVGITMNQIDSMPTTESTGCCSRQSILDARAVADRLGFPHCAVNTMKEFHDKVIVPFIRSYESGLTPNPCAYCNSFVRFEEAFDLAKERDCGYVATGHYARSQIGDRDEPRLRRAVYREKDQSYFLYGVRRELLRRIVFPLGDKTKDEARALARELGLVTADKPDSQEICFTQGRPYNEFLAPYIASREGPILDREGNVLGTHRGVTHYTVGQRKGIGLTGGPFFVLRIDPKRNAIIVGRKHELERTAVQANLPRWISAPKEGDRVFAQIRSRHTPAQATVTHVSENTFGIEFDVPQSAVAPGQALVLSIEDEILGGGTILPD